MFIKDYALLSRPIQKMTRKDIEFEWGPEQELVMDKLKEALGVAPCLKPLNYDWDSDIVMAVDTSWMAVGIQVYQTDPNDPKKHYYAKFVSIMLNRREAEFSQPKRELYGLKRALEAMQYWLLGCRHLVVEIDTKYIQGMLNNLEMGPNTTINRWIEQILMFSFKLKHVKGANFPADGLSRREFQPGDEVWPEGKDELEPNGLPEVHDEWDYFAEQPLDIEEFKHEIDTRGGYLQEIRGKALDVNDFEEELKGKDQLVSKFIKKTYKEEGLVLPAYVQMEVEEKLLLDDKPQDDEEKREDYDEEHHSMGTREQDEKLNLVFSWWKDTSTCPEGFERDVKYKRFVCYASKFFVSTQGKLYRRGRNGMPLLVVQKEHRMYMMRTVHDALGHRGGFATKSMLEQRFWWPELEGDVRWYVKTCHLC
jgi:hypothetical protein